MNPHRKRPVRSAAMAGPVGAVIFAASVVAFAARRTDGYSHAANSISELGARGAPLATSFNVAAFVVPGLAVVALGYAVARSLSRARIGALLLAFSGAALVVTGLVPIDLSTRASAGYHVHVAAATTAEWLWAGAAVCLRRAFARGGARRLGALSPWFALCVVAQTVWQIVAHVHGLPFPGWAQRVGLGGYFLWMALAGVAIARNDDGTSVRAA